MGEQHALDPLGATNTLVLNLSSFTIAMGVYSAETCNRRGLITSLVLTIVLGLAFLGIKTVAYHDKYVDHHIPAPVSAWRTLSSRERFRTSPAVLPRKPNAIG